MGLLGTRDHHFHQLMVMVSRLSAYLGGAMLTFGFQLLKAWRFRGAVLFDYEGHLGMACLAHHDGGKVYFPLLFRLLTPFIIRALSLISQGQCCSWIIRSLRDSSIL